MRPGAALRALALAALAVAASAGCRPTYTCDPGSSACHAKYSCEFSAPCLPGATCTQSFDIGDGVDKTSGLPFNYSTASGSVTGGSLGGRSYCGPAGCDDNALALTFQSADLSVKWVSASCESRETPEQCRLATKTPIPASPPLTKVTAQQTCLNKVTPCTYYKAEATVDFRAAVAWPEPPSPPPTASPPPSPPPAPRRPPAAAARARRVRAGRARAQSLRRVSAGARVCLAAYACAGYLFVRARARESDGSCSNLPSWLRRLTPARCDEELAAGAAGARRECELLWCWCVPAYWRHSERDAMDAYWAYHPVRGDGE